MRQNLYGEEADHPETSSSLSRLVTVMYGLQKLKETRRFVQKALEMNYRICGVYANQPAIEECLRLQGRIFHRQGLLALAKRKAIASLLMCRKLYREDANNPSTAYTLWCLGLILRDQGLLVDAEKRFP